MLAITLALAACSFVPSAAVESVEGGALSRLRGRGGASSAGNGASAVHLGRRQDGWDALGTSALTTRHGQHQRPHFTRSAQLPAGARVRISDPDKLFPGFLSLTGTIVEDHSYRPVQFDPVLVKDLDLYVIKRAEVKIIAGKYKGVKGKLLTDPKLEHKEGFTWVQFDPCDVEIDGLKVLAGPFKYLENGMVSSEKEGPAVLDDATLEEIGMAFMYDQDGPMWDSHAGRSAFLRGTPVEITKGAYKGLTGRVGDTNRVWVKVEDGTRIVDRPVRFHFLSADKSKVLEGRYVHVDKNTDVGRVRFEGGDLLLTIGTDDVVAI